MQKEIMLCAIDNILSGSCREDCKFCTQSIHHGADIERYRLKSTEEIVKDAKIARANKAVGFCMVTAGKALEDKHVEFLCKTAKAVKKAVPEFNLIACNGTATKEQLKALQASGVDSYNHNLETSENYYPQICTTHGWSERYKTCENVKSTGLNLCSGGIFGMGESEQDREELIAAIQTLQPKSVPLNFFMKNPALPLEVEPITPAQALKIVRYARAQLPGQKLMAAGGRESTFGTDQKPLFEAGIDAIVIGDYLTAKGESCDKDIAMIQSYGYGIAKRCR